MLLYALIAIVTIALSFMAKQPAIERKSDYSAYSNSKNQLKNRVILIGIFSVLFLFSAIRVGIGNDYLQYVKTFHEISVGGYVVTESGFNILVRLIYFLCGGECYEVVFALFAFATLALFMYTMWTQSEDFFMTFFLFMTLGLYFQTYNTVRYYFALAVVLYSMKYVKDKITFSQIVPFLLLTGATSLIHKSVLIVIPLFFIASLKWKKWQTITCLFLCVAAFAFKNILLEAALYLYPSYRNTIYLSGGTSIISIVRCMAVLALTVIYYKKCIVQDRKMLFFAQLNMMAIIVYIFFSFLPVVTRIGYYLTVSHIMYLPALIQRIPDEKQKHYIKTIVITCSIVYFCVFLYKASAPGVQLLPYRTWLFESERIWTP